MSHLSPPPAVDRPDSRLSLALSDTTYHSFHDVDLPEPRASQPASRIASAPTTTLTPVKRHEIPVPGDMRRQDSGYESLDRRDSTSSHRRASTVSVTSSTARRRTRPSVSRSRKSGPVSYLPRSGRRSMSPTRSCIHRHSPPREPVAYFHFPHFTASEPVLDEVEQPTKAFGPNGYVSMTSLPARSQTPSYPEPPQTTHYWTSDRTRRLEYAAIDAASRGVRGWVMRHVVPDCFVPKSKRRVGFEDDRGSVVRYRLELEEDGPEKHDRKRRRSWWFSIRR